MSWAQAIPIITAAAGQGLGIAGQGRANRQVDDIKKMLTGMFQTGPGAAESFLMQMFGMPTGGGNFAGLPARGNQLDFNEFAPEQWAQFFGNPMAQTAASTTGRNPRFLSGNGRLSTGGSTSARGGPSLDMMGGTGGSPGIPSIFQMPMLNSGNDGLMQLLRGSGGAGRTLNELATTGNPFDVSQMFTSLQPIEDRMLEETLGDLYGSFSGPGQRFGTAAMRGASDLRGRALEDAMLRRSQISQSAFEAAQGRRLGASQLIGALTGQADELGLRSGVANQNAYAQQIAQMLSALGMLGGMGQQRQGFNAGLAGMFAGMPMPQSTMGAIGSGMGDLASIFAFLGRSGSGGQA